MRMIYRLLAAATLVLAVGGARADGVGNLNPPRRLVSSAATTNLTAISSVPIRLYMLRACNTVASARYIKFYNLASGSVVVGTTPVADSFELPPSQCAVLSAAGSFGEFYNVALSYALTAGNADNDTTALGAGDVVQLAVFAQ